MTRSARTARRYRVGKESALEVFAEPSADDDHVLTGELIDLSRGGLRLRVNTTYPIPDNVTLRIKYSESEEEISVPSVVRWHRKGESNGWWLGCVFEDTLNDETVARLAGAGFMDRRTDGREGFAIAATARSEMNRDERLPVRILNCSAGGFSMLGNGEISLGHRVLVSVCNDKPSIIAKVQWTKPDKGGWKIGCAFLSNTGFQQFREQLAAELKQPPTSTSGRQTIGTTSNAARTWLLGLLNKAVP